MCEFIRAGGGIRIGRIHVLCNSIERESVGEGQCVAHDAIWSVLL